MVVDQPRLRMIAFQVFEGVLVIAATASSGTGVPKVYRVTQRLTEENFYLVDKYGGQGQNRTADTGDFQSPTTSLNQSLQIPQASKDSPSGCPPNAPHQGIPIPRPQRHKTMNSNERWWARQDSNLGPRDYESH